MFIESWKVLGESEQGHIWPLCPLCVLFLRTPSSVLLEEPIVQDFQGIHLLWVSHFRKLPIASGMTLIHDFLSWLRLYPLEDIHMFPLKDIHEGVIYDASHTSQNAFNNSGSNGVLISVCWANTHLRVSAMLDPHFATSHQPLKSAHKAKHSQHMRLHVFSTNSLWMTSEGAGVSDKHFQQSLSTHVWAHLLFKGLSSNTSRQLTITKLFSIPNFDKQLFVFCSTHYPEAPFPLYKTKDKHALADQAVSPHSNGTRVKFEQPFKYGVM